MPMPVKARPLAPAPISSWAGWYIGLNGGYGWADPSASINPAAIPLPATGVLVTPANAFTLSTSPKGWLFGGQIGHNWQFNQMVVGAELDVDWAGLKDTSSGTFLNAITIGGDAAQQRGTATLESKMNWVATLRGRLGYDLGTLLPFVTGGVALSRQQSTVTLAWSNFDIGGGLPGVLVSSFSNSTNVSDTLWGYAVGGGLDWAIAPHWVLRGEYLFLGFEKKTHNAPMAGVTSIENGMNVSVARAALSYRFAP